ncbi:MAG TPA: hypothetical protein VMT63_12170 [Bacteroidales bacterium]|nr:hypothetical protein [Bacteroidales bacterium]
MAYSEKQKRILARMGYFDYQNGLIYRKLNQGKGWSRHLENCRDFILRAVDRYKPGTVTVLGSGWLLDLPLKELTERSCKVNLVDIVHPPEARKQVAQLADVSLTEADVTGGLIWEVWDKTSGFPFFNKPLSPDGIEIPDGVVPGNSDMVISLNIMSQLETLLLRRLREKSRFTGEDYLSFRKKIQKKHLDLLQKNFSLLITDTSEVFVDKKGNESEIESVVIDLPYGELREEWTWDFDLVRSDYYEMSSVLKVVAIVLEP